MKKTQLKLFFATLMLIVMVSFSPPAAIAAPSIIPTATQKLQTTAWPLPAPVSWQQGVVSNSSVKSADIYDARMYAPGKEVGRQGDLTILEKGLRIKKDPGLQNTEKNFALNTTGSPNQKALQSTKLKAETKKVSMTRTLPFTSQINI